MTAGLADHVDLYLEQTGEAGRSAREGDQFVPYEVRQETIHVTPRGPILSPALDGDLGAISMHVTWMDPRPVRGVLALHFEQMPHTANPAAGPMAAR